MLVAKKNSLPLITITIGDIIHKRNPAEWTGGAS